MRRERHITVQIPNSDHEIRLGARKADLLIALMEADTAGLTSLDLAQAGFLGISNTVSVLRDRGALINAVPITLIDDNGLLRRRIAKYEYEGFELQNDACNSPRGLFPKPQEKSMSPRPLPTKERPRRTLLPLVGDRFKRLFK